MWREAVGWFSLGRKRTVPMAHESTGKVHSVVFVATKLMAHQVQGEASCEGKGFLMFGSVLRLQYSVSSRGIYE